MSGYDYDALYEAAKELHKRQAFDAGWGPWGDLTDDDKQAFLADIEAVLETYDQLAER